MADITIVPYDDIINFLQINNKIISDDSFQNYQTALQIIQDKQTQNVPGAILDWIIAQDLQEQGSLPSKIDKDQLKTYLQLNDERADRVAYYLNYKPKSLEITDIPYADIIDYFELNKLPVDKNNIYTEALNLIYLGQGLEAPSAVVDWILAQNLQDSFIPTYKTSYILISPDINLKDLADTLNLPEVDRERIIRILGYLNKLYNDTNLFNILPADALKVIFSNFDCKQMLVACKMTQSLSNFCQTALDDVLKDKLTESTKFNTNNYNHKQLINLCRISPTIQHVNLGSNHSLIIDDQGQLYTSGLNNKGQLGLGDTINKNKHTLLESISNIVQSVGGSVHSLSLTNDGVIYSFGDNYYGQLGLGDFNQRLIPILIPNLFSIIQIAAGSYHSLALTIDGQVYGFGDNSSGQISNVGLKIPNPVLIHNLNNITQISAGYTHSLVLTENNTVYAWGDNTLGQLGLGDTNSRYAPTLISNMTDIIQVSAGFYYSLVLAKSGEVYAFGSNTNQELGLYSTTRFINKPLKLDLKNVKRVSAGRTHSLLLRDNGEAIILSSKPGILGIRDVSEISAGYKNSLVLTDDSKVYGFGSNQYGVLGLGNNNEPNKIEFAMSINKNKLI